MKANRLQTILLVLLGALISLNIWAAIERMNLNREFQRSIEKKNSLNTEFSKIITDYEALLDQLQLHLEQPDSVSN